MTLRRAALATALLLPAAPAAAQSDQEARLREALRRATTDLRTLQDGQARLQAEAAEAKAQRDRLQTQFDAQAARLAELEGKPTEPAPEVLAELEGLRANNATLTAQVQQLQQALAQWQAAFNEAAEVARTKEAERQAWQAAFTRARAGIDAAETKNAALFAAANEILRLYETEDFRRLVTLSGEPVFGFWRVRLENIVQEHEDRIDAGRHVRDPAAAVAPPPATPLPAGLARSRARGPANGRARQAPP
jgi:septal ring factor EnvC (AmiA/AmiB activator)